MLPFVVDMDKKNMGDERERERERTMIVTKKIGFHFDDATWALVSSARHNGK
jgi:hypothetical protein